MKAWKSRSKRTLCEEQGDSHANLNAGPREIVAGHNRWHKPKEELGFIHVFNTWLLYFHCGPGSDSCHEQTFLVIREMIRERGV